MLQLVSMLEPGARDVAAFIQVEVGKVLQLANMLEPGVRDIAAATQVEAGKVLQLAKVLEPGASDMVAAMQVEAGKVLQLANVLETGIGDTALTQVEAGKVLQLANVLEPGVRNFAAFTQVEVAKVQQLANVLKTGVSYAHAPAPRASHDQGRDVLKLAQARKRGVGDVYAIMQVELGEESGLLGPTNYTENVFVADNTCKVAAYSERSCMGKPLRGLTQPCAI